MVEVFIRVIVNVLVPNETYKLENLKLTADNKVKLCDVRVIKQERKYGVRCAVLRSWLVKFTIKWPIRTAFSVL